MKFVTLSIIFFFVSGCTATQYQQPSELANTAKLRVVAGIKNINVFNIQGGDCKKRMLIGTLKNAIIGSSIEKSSIGMPWESDLESKPTPKDFREIIIPANEKFHVFYIALAHNNSYKINFEFSPEPNKLYEFVLGGVGVVAKELVESDGTVSSVAIKTFKPVQSCW